MLIPKLQLNFISFFRQFSSDGVEMHLAVNFLGHFLLTDLLRPLLKK